MWLDRLGSQHVGHVASQPNSRLISPMPLPRRTSSARGPYLTSSQRPGAQQRASSLSLVSNDSSTSLLASAKRANGSALKQFSTVEEGPDPNEVLDQVLHPYFADILPSQKRSRSIAEDDLQIDYDFGGLSLRELAESQAGSRPVNRSQSIQEYKQDKAKFEDLHQNIRACDNVLSSVESNLTNFRNDLAAVSADIETLQARSTGLNIRLENRKAVEKALGPVVEELSVSTTVVSKISEGHIDEAWIKTLAEVDRRATTHRKNAQQARSKASADLGPLLEKLILKAVERIRDFLVTQIKALRSPHINAQIIQQQNFLKFKELYLFLHKHQTTLADEICLAYMNTMRWYYMNQFSRYVKSLENVKLHNVDKNDMIGHEETSRKTTVLTASKAVGPPHDAFNLGRRIEILRTTNQPAVSSYLAEEDQSTHYLEMPFRNFNLALVDNATAEYVFLASFFSPALSFATISRHFNYIFEPTFAMGHSLTKRLVAETHDGLGLLLCVRLNQHFAFELQRRKVPSVDGYINGTAMLLWPRLQNVMYGHSESVRGLVSALPTKPATASAAKAASAAPHVVTQRFGQLLQGILTLSADAGDDEPVIASLQRLRNEFEVFLTKYSQSMFGADKRKQGRFLYNNYSLVLTIISDTDGKLAKEQQEHFEGLKTAYQEAL